MGTPATVCWAATAWLGISPAYGLSLVAVWKDTAFTIALLAAMVIVLRSVEESTLGARRGFWLGMTLALVWLYRQNGPAIVLPALIGLGVFHGRAAFSGLGTALLVLTSVVVLIKGPVYDLTDVRRMPRELPLSWMIHQVAALAQAHDTLLSHSDRDMLEAVMPLEAWRQSYHCSNVVPTLQRAKQRLAVLTRSVPVFVGLWLRLAQGNPGALLRHWACVTRFIWSPGSDLYVGWQDGQTIEPNAFGISTAPLMPRAHGWLSALVRHTFARGSVLRAFVWQPATSLYLVLALGVISCLRMRTMGPLLVLLLPLANTALWLVAATGLELRFMFPIVFAAPLTLCIVTGDPSKWRGRKGSGLVPAS